LQAIASGAVNNSIDFAVSIVLNIGCGELSVVKKSLWRVPVWVAGVSGRRAPTA